MFNVKKKPVAKFKVDDKVVIVGDRQGEEFCTVIHVMEPMQFKDNEDKWTYVIDYNNGLGEDVIRQANLELYEINGPQFEEVIDMMKEL